MILVQDVEIGKLYFMVKIQSGNFVRGCFPNNISMLQSLLIMLDDQMASLSHGLRELVSLQTVRESSAIDQVTVLESIIEVR